MGEGSISNSHCSALSGDRALYCEETVGEQCAQAAAGGDDTADQAKKFLLDLVAPIFQHFSVSTFAECADLVAGLIKIYGTPQFAPVAPPAPPAVTAQAEPGYDLSFVTLDIPKAKKFKKIDDEPMIVVAGRQDDPATAELMQNIMEVEGGKARLLFIDTSNMPKAKKVLKALGIIGNYSVSDPSPQCISHKQQPDGSWLWSADYQYFSVEELEASPFPDPLAGAMVATIPKHVVHVSPSPDPLAGAIHAVDPLAGAYSSVAPVIKEDLVIQPEEVSPTAPQPEGLLVPPEYDAKIEAIIEAEEQAGQDPAPGFMRMLTVSNFHKFFLQNARPVIVAVLDSDASINVMNELQIEEQAKPGPEQALIAVLDTRNAGSVVQLWNKLVGLKQKPGGMIDEEHIKPFAVFTFAKGALGAYTGQVDVGLAPRPPAISELQEQFYFSNIKKDKIKYPMTVYVVRDPTDAQFTTASAYDAQMADGSVFYVDWSDPESRAFATQYLGIPPLTDNYVYTAWQFSGDDLNKHGYFTNLSFVSGQLAQIDTMVNASALAHDPLQFHYVNDTNYVQYFSEQTRRESIVVVGDPLSDDVQALLERLSEEKRDLGHDMPLIMVPQFPGVDNSGVLQKLKINKKDAKPGVYRISWNENGQVVRSKYAVHGFEIAHANNDVWSETVIGSNKNVLLVVGDTNAGYDPQIAAATGQLRENLVEGMADGSVNVSGKKVTKLVYMDRTMLEMIFRSDIQGIDNLSGAQREAAIEELSQSNVVLYQYLKGNALPQMFLISGPEGSRGGTLVAPGSIDVSMGGCMPDEMPAEPVIENLVKKEKQKQLDDYMASISLLEKQGVTEKSVSSQLEGMCPVFGEAFTEITPMSSAWQVNLKKFILVVGNEGDADVIGAKQKLVLMKKNCLEDRRFFFVDTTLPAKGTDEYSTKVAWLAKLFKKIFNIDSLEGDHMVLECKAKNESSFKCEPFQFPE